MNRVGVVVLNYKNFNETIKCVESLTQQQYGDLEIVIVDNGSKNESYDVLSRRFNDNNKINILFNKENLGYARGNNIGIEFLRGKGISHVLVCNSDVEFSSNRIISQIIDQCQDSVGTIIPIIRNLDGSIEARAQYKRKLFILRIIKELINTIYLNKKEKTNNVCSEIKHLDPGVQNEYHVITGSVFLLTPSFFKYYNGLFPNTFLYVEELATMTLVHKANLLSAIANTDDVIHKGAASTDSTLKSGTKQKKEMAARSAKKVFGLALTPRNLIKMKYGI